MNTYETAIHEAGHACARLLIEGRACAAALNDDPGAAVKGWSGGDPNEVPTAADFDTTACERSAAGLDFTGAFGELCVVESGHAAVMLARRSAWMPFTHSAGDGRLADALTRRMLKDGDTATLNALVEVAYRYAVCRLARVFAGVEAVAAALEVKRRLTAEEVAEAYAAGLRAEGAGSL